MKSMFYFDCFDGERHAVDHHGIDLRTEAEAREHAIALAQALLVDALPEADARSISVTVRAGTAGSIFVAQCNLTGCWTKDRAPAPPAGGAG